jgi:hypothetical protein
MDEPVQHGVGDGGVADVLMPVVDGHLAGDDGRGPVVAIIDDLHQVAPLFAGQRRNRPIIEDQQVHPGQVLQGAGVTAVTACDAEPLQQPGHALIQHGSIVAAGTMAQSARQPGFACSRLPRDEQILMAFDPFAARQFLEQGAVETAGGTVIDILGCGLLAEARKTQPGCETFAVSLVSAAVKKRA